MKIRMESGSLRLRLKKSDLEALKSDKSVEEVLIFPNGNTFRYSLTILDKETVLHATSEARSIAVCISSVIHHKWIDGDDVGIERILTNEDGSTLRILVEKDFPCLDRIEENKSDTFWELAEKKEHERK